MRFGEIDSEIMVAYELHLKMTGVSKNTSSFYLRILRAVYNRAVEEGFCTQRHPFKHVYTGIAKTAKRALALDALRRIRDMELASRPQMDYARNMFLLSFYLRGMSFVDMAYLKREDLQNGMHHLLPEKDRAAAFDPLGALHAADRGALSQRKSGLPAADSCPQRLRRTPAV